MEIKELEVRFVVNKKDNTYTKLLEYLEENYTFLESVHQKDTYFKELGKDLEKDIEGSYIYRVRVSNDEYIFTRKDTISEGLWEEEEITLSGDESKFLERVLKSGFTNVLVIDKYRKTFVNDKKSINLDKIDGLGTYIEVELLGDFSKNDIDFHKISIAEEFSFVKAKVDTKGYVQLVREHNESN